MRELTFFGREIQVVNGLGKRELPSNPDSSAIPLTLDHLSINARGFWGRRKYGAFAVSILTDLTIRMAVDQLGHEETTLFGRYLIGKLAADDRQAVKALPKGHPDRRAFAEIFWYEKQRAPAIVDSMICALKEKTGSNCAEEAVELICQELAGAADDAKRIFFRKLTKEVGAVERDNLIASRLRVSIAQITRIKDQAIAKSN